MSLETIFSYAGTLALAGWLLLIIFPRRPVAIVVAGLLVPVLLAAIYLMLIVTHLPGAPGGFGSLADVASLFQREGLLLAGWIHYLAFDLFIGAWETRDAERHQIPHLVVIPALIMTFLLGPVGLLFYLAIRTAKSRRLNLEAA